MTCVFQIGQTYMTSSVMDHNCIYKIKVIGRTVRTVKVQDESGNLKTLRVFVYRDVEQVKPKGSYSFAPIIGADDTKVLKTDWQGPGSRAEIEDFAAEQAAPAMWDGTVAHARILNAAAIMQQHVKGIENGELIIELASALSLLLNAVSEKDIDPWVLAKGRTALTKLGMS